MVWCGMLVSACGIADKELELELESGQVSQVIVTLTRNGAIWYETTDSDKEIDQILLI